MKKKLTPEDIKFLLNKGYLQEDIPQIQKAISRSSYSLYNENTDEEKFISASEALDILGRKEFLSGIARSAFHWSSCRRTSKGDAIYFDSSALFRHLFA